MSAFTCISCHVAFSDAEFQRDHYKTDWHRYNLKRKVVGMPPVTAAVFQEKVREHRVVGNKEATEGVSGLYCKLCQKKFGTHKAYENHSKSRKHRDLENAHLDLVRKSLSKDDLSGEKVSNSSEDDSNNVRKILADARADIEKPRIIRSEGIHNPTKEYAPGDNPRMRWFRKQAKALKDAELLDEEWEDIDNDESMDDSQDESVVLGDVGKDDDADVESIASDAISGTKQSDIEPSECLFCLKRSKDIEMNVLHMSRSHGFFIPDIQYLVDLEGLLKYLGEKVCVGNICLWCNEKGKAFYSTSAVLKHMKDKGHCNMLVTGDAALEYADFYDFGEMEDEDMETCEEYDENEEIAYDDSQDLELVLPSGALIGHRNLMKYYKQKFPTVDRTHSKKQKRLARLIAQYKAIGWKGSSASESSRSQKDLAYLQTMKAKYKLRLSVKNNSTQMKHFRSQIFI